MVETADSININARIHFVNDPTQTDKWNSDRRRWARDGIVDSWSGNYNGKQVQVSIEEVGDTNNLGNSQGYMTIEIRADDFVNGSHMEQHGHWSKEKPGTMALYDYNPNWGIQRETEYSQTAGHEFGHALGVGEAYKYTIVEKTNPDGSLIRSIKYKCDGPTPSIMNNQYKVGVAQAVDYEIVLKAQATNEWQDFGGMIVK